MATSYTAVITIPNTNTESGTWNNVSIKASSGGASSGGGTLLDALTDLKTVYENDYGGTFSWTSFDNGTDTIYTITFTGLTSDPPDTPLLGGELVCIGIGSDNATTYYSNFAAETVATLVCDSCYEQVKDACATEYTFSYDLEPATTYTVAFYMANGNVYTQEVLTNGSGEFTIDATAPEFPEGFWTPESGGYIMKVFPDASLENPESLTVGSYAYNCVQLAFQYVTTTTSSYVQSFSYLLHDYDGELDFTIDTEFDSMIIDE